jgi:poly-gamma-glutamate synthesis protein (capsule biosynthesis protein)
MGERFFNVKRLFFLIIFSSHLFAQISPQQIFPPETLLRTLDKINSDSVKILTFSFVGDLMCHSTQFNYARIDSDKFDFKPVFEPIKKYLETSDFTLGNLETVTAGEELGYHGYPLFNTPDEFVEALAYAGFDILFTSNNHALDRNELGVKRTIEIIRKNGMYNVGTGEKGERRFAIFRKDGITFALLAYTYGTNGFELPDTSRFAVNVISRKILREDLALAESLSPDFTIVYFHFGTEYSREPDDFQLDYAHYALRKGADIVVGSHPHVIQRIENVRSKRFEKSFIAYSLGNFISNQRWRYSDCGVILNFSVKKNILRNKTALGDLNYLPIWVYKGAVDSSGKQGYRFYAVRDTLSTKPNPFFSEEDLKNMNEAFRDIKEIFESNGAEIKIGTSGDLH